MYSLFPSYLQPLTQPSVRETIVFFIYFISAAFDTIDLDILLTAKIKQGAVQIIFTTFILNEILTNAHRIINQENLDTDNPQDFFKNKVETSAKPPLDVCITFCLNKPLNSVCFCPVDSL